jgi:hypothetical protein
VLAWNIALPVSEGHDALHLAFRTPEWMMVQLHIGMNVEAKH